MISVRAAAVNALQAQVPLFLVLALVASYLAGRLGVLYFQTKLQNREKTPARLRDAEKGNFVQYQQLKPQECFELEKRAFFCKTWLFVCHQSRFNNIGDYHTFKIAEVPFFIVLGKDSKLRAFHNVCRHRAYTVVRKPCGTSTRFSCKYHGWQYDDQGSLVKAPQFETNPGFEHKKNALYEIKLLLTQEGLVFVNFDASTTGVPFAAVKSKSNMGPSRWVEGFNISTQSNWKSIAQEFSEQVSWSESALGWLPAFRKPKYQRLLGPLSLLRELGNGLWCTMILLPLSAKKTDIWIDLFVQEGQSAERPALTKWRNVIEEQVMAYPEPHEGASGRSRFMYECGGRAIDLAAITSHHQRMEKLSKRKIQPAIRFASNVEVDQEASDLCDALDGREPDKTAECPKLGDFGRQLEW